MHGVKVTIAGHQLGSAPFSVHSQALGASQPPGTGPVGLGSPLFYDVSVHGINAGTATVSITEGVVSPQSKMEYWDKGKWTAAANQSVAGGTISGEIPVSSLHGTPIVIGT